jgi:hypothetical protein
MKILISFLLLYAMWHNSLFASDCTYSIKQDGVKVKWTAFKTPAKAGVSGIFKKLGMSKHGMGKSLKGVLTGATYKIDTESIFSKNPGRDIKIAKFFFSTLEGGPQISGEILGMDPKKKRISLQVKMNDIVKTVPLSYSIQRNKLVAKGHIDIFDFAMGDELKALNKACFEKHEGKTWSDVSIELQAKFIKKCKKIKKK